MEKRILPFWPIILMAVVSLCYISTMFILYLNNIIEKSFENVLFIFTLPVAGLIAILSAYTIIRTVQIIKKTKNN